MGEEVFNPYSLFLKEENVGPIAKDIRRIFLSNQYQCLVHKVLNLCLLLPIIHFVADYLSPIDLINLSIVSLEFNSNKELKRSILPSFRRNLFGLLVDGGHSEIINELYKLLSPRSCILSGSIVLQAILGVCWMNSDVDIYCLNRIPFSAHYLLLAKGYEGTNHTMDLDESYYFLMGSVMHIHHVHDYFSRSNRFASKIQVIDMNPNVSAESCVDHFDLDIVQNYFNGEKLFIKSIASLTSKVGKVQRCTRCVTRTIGKASGSLVNVLKRLLALHNDGVIQINLENWYPLEAEKTLKSIFIRIFSRFEKYIQRGFVIEDRDNIWTSVEIGIILARLRRNNKKMRADLINFIRFMNV